MSQVTARRSWRETHVRRHMLWTGIGAGVVANVAWALIQIPLGLYPTTSATILWGSFVGCIATTALVGALMTIRPNRRRLGIGVVIGALTSPIATFALDFIVVAFTSY